jgi:hypothetical protein
LVLDNIAGLPIQICFRFFLKLLLDGLTRKKERKKERKKLETAVKGGRQKGFAYIKASRFSSLSKYV